MKLNCPECGAPIPPANINIQKMAAVCPDCGAVFQFDPAQAKSKRRKVHQPQNLELRETDEHVEMAFRTNFRLSQNGEFNASAWMSAAFTFMTVMIGGGYLSGEILSGGPIIGLIPAGFAVFTLFLYYWLASIIYNKTHIEMDDEKISVSRKPFSILFGQKDEVSLAGVTVIRYEETPISKKEGYDLPRYNVWAETADGSRRVIVKDVIEDYAVFIAQRLNEQLALDADPDVDVSRLMDDDTDFEIEDDDILHAVIQTSNEPRRK